jgi:hypothetical protein
MAAVVSAAAPDPVNGDEVLQYTPPVGSELVGGEFDARMEADGNGYNASATAVAYTPSFTYEASDVIFQCAYGLAACGFGPNFEGVVTLPDDRGGDLYVGAGCGGSGSECDSDASDGAWAQVDINWADLLLANAATPTGTSFGGTLLSPDARGEAELVFVAGDPSGPGVYSVAVSSEGQTLYDGTPKVNGGCESVGVYDGALMFDGTQPCRETEPVDLPIDSAALVDGTHVLKVTVTDAAANSSVVYDEPITTSNAPADTSEPTILDAESPTIGTPLTGEPGAWSAPSGAGLVSYAYKWQRCDDKEGERCSSITGSESLVYDPTSSDVGYPLRLAVTATDADGSTTTYSQPTVAVPEPTHSQGAENGPGTGTGTGETGTGTKGGDDDQSEKTTVETEDNNNSSDSQTNNDSQSHTSTQEVTGARASATPPNAVIRLGVKRRVTRSYAKRALKHLAGRLLTVSGQPIEQATITVLQKTSISNRYKRVGTAKTGSEGAFVARVPAGPSRLIELAYRHSPSESGYAATATIRESVRAGVLLHIAPRSTTNMEGEIELSGRVSGPIPKGGVQVDLLVFYRHRWVPFRTPRTDETGRFKAFYAFEGGIGRWPMQARVAAGQASFPFSSGTSKIIDVSTH